MSDCLQFGFTRPVDELVIGFILARRRGLVDSFAAHGAFVAFRAVRTVVWSVFGARGSPLVLFDELGRFQLWNLTSKTAR
ncbi:MAG: hypothetical protein AUI93_03515 [Crenarchaeota archaeon 13_1_40CM_3_52_10]|nr:MAG: hypothetical protein AUI93_03515 [Crenarchaeota archaeon 13_1_40CM_3_52_10]